MPLRRRLVLGLLTVMSVTLVVVAAATFHATGRTEVAEIGQAYELLSPLLGLGIAWHPEAAANIDQLPVWLNRVAAFATLLGLMAMLGTYLAQRREVARLEKLTAIEALGLDPWGERFDGHRPIHQARELCPAEPGTVGPEIRK